MAETSSKPPFNPENPPSLNVIQAVADANGVDPLDLSPPLSDVIDTDELDALLHDPDFDGKIEFTYLGYQVTINAEGQIAHLEAIP